jgi:hypothetical protein
LDISDVRWTSEWAKDAPGFMTEGAIVALIVEEFNQKKGHRRLVK